MKKGKPLILITDDTPSNIHILLQELKSDYRIKVATNGELALEIANGPDKPDLILLDVIMPGMDGFEVCKRLKSNPDTHHIPVIFLTALGSSTDEEKGLDLGAADYITKPFVLPVLRARVRNQIALKRSIDLLETLAFLDGLTRLNNRRSFDEALDTEWKRARRSGLPLSLLFADIDHFKKLNDHFGHGHGDICLTRVAECLSETVMRPADFVARYGGEEFVALLPETDELAARDIAERFRKSVEQLGIRQAPGLDQTFVTVSVGCASRLPQTEGSPILLVEAADMALYRAKREGRNRVCP